jgi:hypothetical protein
MSFRPAQQIPNDNVEKYRQVAGPLFFVLGRGLTPVPRLCVGEARELAQIILEDESHRIGDHKGVPFREATYAGKHIFYRKLPKWLRGSDRVARIRSAVKIMMLAGFSQARACREIAIFDSKLGKSKRGRPVKSSQRTRQKHEIVRSLYNSFERRNPLRPSEDSADFVDAQTEFWFHYAATILAIRKRSKPGFLWPHGWQAKAAEQG